ncbi:MAG: metallophosphoesterase [Leptospira sp.]|nr:metallophosphoesterase [Leptospira sp.]
MKLLQFSDLHLSENNDPEYGLQVLKEIISKAITLNCEALLLCGDIFDTYNDLESLRTKVIDLLKSFSGAVFFLPGNHESLRRQNAEKGFRMFDWGNQIQFLEEEPFSHRVINDEVELIAIAHRESYANLLGKLPPKKKSKVRICLLHATVIGMSFSGIREEIEEGGGLIDVSQLQALDCDFVSVGHIHSARSQVFGAMEIAYAGSARVWRKGEVGIRGGLLLEVKDSKVTKSFVHFESAGQYIELNVQPGLDGIPNRESLEILSKLSKFDWVRINWFGVVDTMEVLMQFQRELEMEWKPKLRILEFDNSALKVVANISENTYIKKFIQLMESKKEHMKIDEWTLTKRLGLELLLEEKK